MRILRKINGPPNGQWGGFVSRMFGEVEGLTRQPVKEIIFYQNDQEPSTLPTVTEMVMYLPESGLCPKPDLASHRFTQAQQAVIDRAWVEVEALQEGRKGEVVEDLWGAKIVLSASKKLYQGWPLRATFIALDKTRFDIYG